MRFVLDNNVDARVQGIIHKAGHECWRASDAGLAAAADDDLSVYADNKKAVLVTHDREFTERRKSNTFGQHVRLKCPPPDACSVIALHLVDLIDELERQEVVVVELSAHGVKVFPPKWR